jgi:hypothetical protein
MVTSDGNARLVTLTARGWANETETLKASVPIGLLLTLTLTVLEHLSSQEE